MADWERWMDIYATCGEKGAIIFGRDGTEYFRRGLEGLDSKNLKNFLEQGRGKIDSQDCKICDKKFMFLRNSGSGLIFKSGDESVVITQTPGADPNCRLFVLMHTGSKPEFVLNKLVESAKAENVPDLPDDF